MPRPGYTKYLGRSRVTRGVSFRIDARTRKNVGVDPQEPSRDETGVDATGVALNEVQLGELAPKARVAVYTDGLGDQVTRA